MNGWPFHLIAVLLPDEAVSSGITDLLSSSCQQGVIRVLDGGVLVKGDEGEVEFRALPELPLEEDPCAGRLVAALFGCNQQAVGCSDEILAESIRTTVAFGVTSDDIDEIVDAIPRASTALILVVEHRWICGFSESVIDDCGTVVAHGWITPGTVREVCGGSRFDAGEI